MLLYGFQNFLKIFFTEYSMFDISRGLKWKMSLLDFGNWCSYLISSHICMLNYRSIIGILDYCLYMALRCAYIVLNYKQLLWFCYSFYEVVIIRIWDRACNKVWTIKFGITLHIWKLSFSTQTCRHAHTHHDLSSNIHFVIYDMLLKYFHVMLNLINIWYVLFFLIFQDMDPHDVDIEDKVD